MPVGQPPLATANSEDHHTPVMQQYLRCKAQYPDSILFFRLGDFYEMFFEDAHRASQMLDLTLTSRGKDRKGHDIPMAGVPHHAASSYIARLLQLGQRVALCEQMADPSTVKGVVPREVVQVITPGLVLDHDTLDARVHNYLVAVATEQGAYGMAALELSTAELLVCKVLSVGGVLAELARLQPQEIVLDDASTAQTLMQALEQMMPRTIARVVEPPAFGDTQTEDWLRALHTDESVDVLASLESPMRRAVIAALGYARAHQPVGAQMKFRLHTYDVGSFLGLDATAIRNLELTNTLSGDRSGSLLHLLDQTCSSVGGRLLRRHLLTPLTDLSALRRRHDAVEAFVSNGLLRAQLRSILSHVGDLERLATRAEAGLANPRELAALRDGLVRAQEAKALLNGLQSHELSRVLAHSLPTDDCADILERLRGDLVECPAASIGQGEVIREGVNPRIDEFRLLSSSSKDVMLKLEQAERSRTGIGSLKIKYTRAFGYYIEVTRSKLESVPPDYRRKQTLVGSERYVTDALTALEGKILTANERLRAIEEEQFKNLRAEVGRHALRIRNLALQLGALDVSTCWAEVALRRGYVRPELDTSCDLELHASRHPVVEALATSGSFVPNDLSLAATGGRLAVITGPNMAGKSTVMRQAALAVIMAQSGGYVAATSARIGLVDRIFTRIGASDNLVRGQSTFMVEMQETATLLHGATPRSLVLLDEIGRGTSTYDGLAIAWAVAKHLAQHTSCRTLFATHYHELCQLAGEAPERVKNTNVLVHEDQGKVVFLHKLVDGAASRSYGLAVAELAGVPASVLASAKKKLAELEQSMPSSAASQAVKSNQVTPIADPKEQQLLIELRAQLRALDLDATAPIDALLRLSEIRKRLV